MIRYQISRHTPATGRHQHQRTRIPAAIAAVMLLGCVPASGKIDTSPRPGAQQRAVVRHDDPVDARAALMQMNAHWYSRWYATAIVRLEVTFLGLGAPPPAQWGAIFSVPERSRVDYLATDGGSGLIYLPGAVYGFQDGTRAAVDEHTDLPILALGHLPGMQVDAAMEALAGARVDTTSFRAMDDESGRRMWVIGSRNGADDSLRSEVRIDAESRLVRHAIDVRPAGSRFVTTEARVESWLERDGLLVPHQVNRYREGRHVMQERWVALAVDYALPLGIFDPDQWGKVEAPAPPFVRRSP